MRRFFKMFFLIFTGVVLFLVAVFLSNEWNRAALGSRGYIDNGSKFGVKIGSSYLEAKQGLLSRGLILYDPMEGQKLSETGTQRCHGQEYADNITLEGFSDHSWRRGIICVASKDGKVIRLSWHYGMLQP